MAAARSGRRAIVRVKHDRCLRRATPGGAFTVKGAYQTMSEHQHRRRGCSNRPALFSLGRLSSKPPANEYPATARRCSVSSGGHEDGGLFPRGRYSPEKPGLPGNGSTINYSYPRPWQDRCHRQGGAQTQQQPAQRYPAAQPVPFFILCRPQPGHRHPV